MHRTNRVPRIKFWSTLLGLGLGALLSAGMGMAQERQAPPPPPEATPRSNVLIVPIGGSLPLRMKGNKPIRTVENQNERVLEIRTTPEPTTIYLLGKEAGTSRITLTALDDTKEGYDVIVQLDIEYLRSVLQRTVPTANLSLIPIGANSIIIGGTVNHAEDIDIIMRTANAVMGGAAAGGVGGDRIINAMKMAGVQQVQLDCVVAFVNRSLLRQMGFDWLETGAHHVAASSIAGGLVVPTPGSAISGSSGNAGLTIPNTVGSPSNLFLALINQEEQFFGFLQAMRDESLTKILAEPKLTILSGRSANLLSGGEQAVPSAGGLGTTTVQFQPFGTQLTVMPLVMGNGKIHLEIEPIVSNLDPASGTSIGGTTVPGRLIQSLHTTVEIETGQTLAIGGLIENDVTASTSKIPILGDLPFIGAAFSRKNFQETEKELVVLVTPHLVDPMSCDQLPKLLPGQETRSPDDFELFLEQLLESPRGPREICHDGVYVPAYKNGPTAGAFPCGGYCGGNNCRGAGLWGSKCAGARMAESSNGYHAEAPAGPEMRIGTSGSSGRGADLLPPTDAVEPAGSSLGEPPTGPGRDSKPAALPTLAPYGASGGR
jgi:pilus assembly protein CpaC